MAIRETIRRTARQTRDTAQQISRLGSRADQPGRTTSQIGRIIGKGMVRMADDAQRLGEGMERVFGENMTRPGDGFDRMAAGERARNVVRNGRVMSFSSYDTERGGEQYDKAFFGRQGYKNDPSNDANFWDQRGQNQRDFY